MKTSMCFLHHASKVALAPTCTAADLVFLELFGPFVKTGFCVFEQPVASRSLLRGIQTALAPRPGSIILKTSVIGESV